MVKKEKVEKKLPILLTDGQTTSRPNLYKYQWQRERLRIFANRNPSVFDKVVSAITATLERFEEAMNKEITLSQFVEMLDQFEAIMDKQL